MSAMTLTYVSTHTTGRAVNAQLAPLMVVVLIAFLVIGMALPVLPLHVHDRLGFSALMVGFVAGSQFAASLVSRVWSGRICDEEGPKRAVLIGLAAATLAGFLYLLSLWFTAAPGASVAILLAGRAVLGGAESFIITGATVWGSRASARKTPARSSLGPVRLCSRPSPGARRSASSSTRMAASGRSRRPRRLPRSQQSPSSRRCKPHLPNARPAPVCSMSQAKYGCLVWARRSAALALA
jgi:hypothetical protein